MNKEELNSLELGSLVQRTSPKGKVLVYEFRGQSLDGSLVWFVKRTKSEWSVMHCKTDEFLAQFSVVRGESTAAER